MVSGTGMPPMLNLKRSSQSGSKGMTALAVAVYSESCAQPYLFSGAHIDLSTMAGVDSITITIQKQLSASGGYVNHDQMVYTGPQPSSHPSIYIPSIPDVYGVRITMQQTAGVLRTINCEFYDAKRLGSA